MLKADFSNILASFFNVNTKNCCRHFNERQTIS